VGAVRQQREAQGAGKIGGDDLHAAPAIVAAQDGQDAPVAARAVADALLEREAVLVARFGQDFLDGHGGGDGARLGLFVDGEMADAASHARVFQAPVGAARAIDQGPCAQGDAQAAVAGTGQQAGHAQAVFARRRRGQVAGGAHLQADARVFEQPAGEGARQFARRQLAQRAQADDDGAAGALRRIGLQHHQRGIGALREAAQRVDFLQLARQQAVEKAHAAAQRFIGVAAAHDGGVGRGHAAVDDGNAQSRRVPLGRDGGARGADGRVEQLLRLRVQRRRVGRVGPEAGWGGARRVRRMLRQRPALARVEQLRDGREMLFLQQQVAMRHGQVAGVDAGGNRALPRRAPVAIGAPRHFDAAAVQAQRHRRVGAAGQVAAVPCLQRGAGQQGRRGARRRQRRRLGRLPAAGLAGVRIAGRQRGPGLRVEVVDGAARLRPGQHFQHAGEGAHEAEKLAPRMLPGDPAGQHAHQRIASQQHLHHGVAALVGRAHLQQAAAGDGAEALPAVLQGQARHQPAHAVGQDAQRLAALLRVMHGRVEHGQEGRGGVLQRQTPVVGKGPHFPALREKAGERFVARFEPAGADDVRLAHGQAFDAAFHEVDGVEPDAVAAHLQMAAHDVGQQQHDGRLLAPFRHFAAARQHAVLHAGQRQPGRIVARQRLHGSRAGRRAFEVVQVVHLRPAQQQLAHGRAAHGAARHRGAIDHQVALPAIKHVAEAVAQPAQQAVAAAVARQHVQGAGHAHVRRIEQGHQGRVGHHRLESGQDARIAALLHHGQQEGEGAVRRVARRRALQQLEHHAGPAVQAAGHQRGAARGTGHAHEAGDADGARLQLHAQLAQARRVLGVAGAPA